MKLLPPTASQIDTDDMPQVPARLLVSAETRVAALRQLDFTVRRFSKALGAAIDHVENMEDVAPALSLDALLSGAAGLLNSVSNGDTPNDGHKGSGTRASASLAGVGVGGAKRRGRPRKNPLALDADGNPVKRGRGRPKGSKNKSADDAAEPVKKRGRGRPKGSGRGPGRPRKVVAEPVAKPARKPQRAAKRSASRKPARRASKPVVAAKKPVAKKTASKPKPRPARKGGARNRREAVAPARVSSGTETVKTALPAPAQ